MSDSEPDFDVGIIGGGPAGASMAAYLAKAGVRCVVFERALFPRPHVGESLVPSSTRVFKELDFLDTMDQAGFVRKYGAVWTTATSRTTARVDFGGLDPDCHVAIRFGEREQPGVDRNYTFHVDRGKFDLLLLQHAHRLGATVYEGVKVEGVDFSDGNPAVRFRLGRQTISTRVRIVIDASGRQTLLGRQLGLLVKDPVFDQYALHAWFDGFDRGTSADHDDIHVHFSPISNTWMWQIPITGSITSFGVVTQKRHFAAARAERETFFWDTVGSRPELAERLRRAAQVRPLSEEGDYSYAMRRICGDRFLLVGDAARFVDPIFSTGVSIALNSARFASRDVQAALEHGRFEAASFANYETVIRRGTRNWYRFIALYYRLNILFTRFVLDPRTRLDVLKLLQGDVYDEDEPAVMTTMHKLVTEVEANPSHPWHQLLDGLTVDAFKDAL